MVPIVPRVSPRWPSSLVHSFPPSQTLFFVCHESFEHLYPTEPHPILQPNVTVQIGLGKSTKLEKVMKRYIQVCNEHRPNGSHLLRPTDLDFWHVQLLSPYDTPEAAALMKHDRVRVARERRQERAGDMERRKLQRELDRDCWEQWQRWLLAPPAKDDRKVALLCREEGSHSPMAMVGSLAPAPREKEEPVAVLRCDEVIASKRCRWLGALISRAKYQKQLEPAEKCSASSRASHRSEDEDMVQPLHGSDALHDQELPHLPVGAPIENDLVGPIILQDRLAAAAAAKIESDDDDSHENDPNLISVAVDFPVDAVRLLLEYVYTNRVVPFGGEAFLTACRTRPSEKRAQGPVPPFDVDRRPWKRWPNKGIPTVSFEVCLSAIKLAETASMPRFSLMAEVAAAQLLTARQVVAALLLCDEQQQLSGNPLAHLRRAAMEIVLRSQNLLLGQPFGDSLRQHGRQLVSTLLAGAVDAVEAEEDEEHHNKIKKGRLEASPNQWLRTALDFFPVIDRKERYARERERTSRRRELGAKGKRSVQFADDYRPRVHGMKRSIRHLFADAEGLDISHLGDGGGQRAMDAKVPKRRTRRTTR